MSIFTEEMLQEMIQRYNDGATYEELSFDFPASTSTIQRHLKGKVEWRPAKPRGPQKNNANAKGRSPSQPYLEPQARIVRPSAARHYR